MNKSDTFSELIALRKRLNSLHDSTMKAENRYEELINQAAINYCTRATVNGEIKFLRSAFIQGTTVIRISMDKCEFIEVEEVPLSEFFKLETDTNE